MFTGIVEATGKLDRLETKGRDARLHVVSDVLGFDDAALGDSICVSGVCLTATNLSGNGFAADVSAETLACTTLGGKQAGDEVNLEKSLTATTRLGGHLVSGHVDGVGEVVERRADGRSIVFTLAAPDALARYIAAKGSVCLDGVSLTVNRVQGAQFEINIIPHTLEATTLKHWVAGTRVNLEVDVIARYVERLVTASNPGDGVDMNMLSRCGFVDKT